MAGRTFLQVDQAASSDIIADQTIALDGYATRKDYPVHLRRVRFRDPESGKTLVFLTNVNLSYTEIRAPFDGRLGRNQAPVGALISVAGAPLNTLVQLDPIYVAFNPSETDLIEMQKARAAGTIAADIILPGETKARHKGELTFIDNMIDRSTGTVVARATIRNADLSLLPGQFVRVRLAIGMEPDALMVPQTALGSSQLGKYVYVVGEGNKADQRLVSLGPTDGNLVAVLKGVSEGEHVISGNLQKIGPGAAIQPSLQ